MTRVNVGVDPRELERAALLAEHREMKRIPNQVAEFKVAVTDIPDFRFGQGHIKFFTTRLFYLLRRYRAVHAECVRREYNVTDYSSAWDRHFVGSTFPLPCRKQMHDYKPTARDRKLTLARLAERGHELRKIRGRDKSL